MTQFLHSHIPATSSVPSKLVVAAWPDQRTTASRADSVGQALHSCCRRVVARRIGHRWLPAPQTSPSDRAAVEHALNRLDLRRASGQVRTPARSGTRWIDRQLNPAVDVDESAAGRAPDRRSCPIAIDDAALPRGCRAASPPERLRRAATRGSSAAQSVAGAGRRRR